LERHATGDSGDVSEARKEMNEAAIQSGGLVISRYQVAPALNVVILTNEAFSFTKCMLLSEFLDDLND
jgi:sorbitol-specific phosphotransferase system component IIC